MLHTERLSRKQGEWLRIWMIGTIYVRWDSNCRLGVFRALLQKTDQRQIQIQVYVGQHYVLCRVRPTLPQADMVKVWADESGMML